MAIKAMPPTLGDSTGPAATVLEEISEMLTKLKTRLADCADGTNAETLLGVGEVSYTFGYDDRPSPPSNVMQVLEPRTPMSTVSTVYPADSASRVASSAALSEHAAGTRRHWGDVAQHLGIYETDLGPVMGDAQLYLSSDCPVSYADLKASNPEFCRASLAFSPIEERRAKWCHAPSTCTGHPRPPGVEDRHIRNTAYDSNKPTTTLVRPSEGKASALVRRLPNHPRGKGVGRGRGRFSPSYKGKGMKGKGGGRGRGGNGGKGAPRIRDDSGFHRQC